MVVVLAVGLALPLATATASAAAVGTAKPKLQRAPKTKKQPRTKRKGLQRRPSQPVQPPPEDPPPPPPDVAETGALAGLTAAHNAARSDVGVAGLTWSPQLAGYAQQWADHLAADNNCSLQHRQGDSYGENMFWTTTPRSAAYVVSQWTAEKAQYDHDTHSCDGVCNHYTQVVWSATTTLGCGMATCGQTQVWVCNYDPQGNYVGQTPY